MTYEEAKRILHPETTLMALAEVEYYGGFNGDEAKIKAVEDACIIACDAIEKQIAEPTHEWINVKDRLPETIPCKAGTEYSEAVVVLTSGRTILTAVYNGKEFITDAEFWEAEEETITHWKSVLPLPQSPKESDTQ